MDDKAMQTAVADTTARWELDVQPRSYQHAALLVGISLSLASMYGGDADAERKWMRTSFDGLGNKTPLELVPEFAGARQVIDLIESFRAL